MSDPTNDPATPDQFARLARAAREAREFAEAHYAMIYVGAWTILRTKAQSIQAVRANTIRNNLEVPAGASATEAAQELEREVDRLLDPATADRVSHALGEQPMTPIVLALADVQAARPPRFPRLFNPKAMETFRGNSDWVPKNRARFFTADCWGRLDPLNN